MTCLGVLTISVCLCYVSARSKQLTVILLAVYFLSSFSERLSGCPPLHPPGCDWILLSPCYVETDGDVAGWRELFSKLGVRDGLIIRKERQTLTAKELVRGTYTHSVTHAQKHTMFLTDVPVSTDDKRPRMCGVSTQYLLVAWTPATALCIRDSLKQIRL